MLTPSELETRFPHLFTEVIWPWGPTRARFMLLNEPPPAALISNINVIPRCEDNWLILRLSDSNWEILGGTLEPGESYLETARRELLEEAGARLLSLRIFGGWHCHSLAAKPYRPHLPHPEFYRLVGLGQVEIITSPTNPAGAEQVARVDCASLDAITERFISIGRHDLAEVYRLAETCLVN